jgi:hypothetical protein
MGGSALSWDAIRNRKKRWQWARRKFHQQRSVDEWNERWIGGGWEEEEEERAQKTKRRESAKLEKSRQWIALILVLGWVQAVQGELTKVDLREERRGAGPKRQHNPGLKMEYEGEKRNSAPGYNKCARQLLHRISNSRDGMGAWV